MFDRLGCLCALLAFSLSASPVHRPPGKPLPHASGHAPTPASKSVKSAKSRGYRGRHAQAVRPYVQLAPAPDRYQEIQQALAAKGYFKGAADGTWGPDSATALEKFQSDHNLQADGKLSSLSLIGLGLGPNRELAAKTDTAAQPSASPERQ